MLETEVFPLVVTGMLNKQSAAALDTAEKTVKVHRARIMKKMRAGSVADATGKQLVRPMRSCERRPSSRAEE